MRGENPLIFSIDKSKRKWYNRAARERTWRAEFLSIDGLHKFLGQLSAYSANRQNPVSMLYCNHSKGRKTHKTGKGNNMINIRSILKLAENDGMTLKYGKKINYKSGWQVATEGVECKTAREAINAVKAYAGNCGVWLANGIYYVDKSKRVQTKKQALEIGKACNQISVYGCARGHLAYC